jgi:hypothetical protein
MPPEPTPFEKAVTILVMLGVYFWIFALGSIIGSYLNVVAYRMPRGKPLFWPPSSCPACGARIAIRDNIPVLGWIILKGKCRNCGQPISPRYPIVEAVVGFLFLILSVRELFTDGGNLPFRESNPQSTVMTTLLFPQPLVISIYRPRTQSISYQNPSLRLGKRPVLGRRSIDTRNGHWNRISRPFWQESDRRTQLGVGRHRSVFRLAVCTYDSPARCRPRLGTGSAKSSLCVSRRLGDRDCIGRVYSVADLEMVDRLADHLAMTDGTIPLDCKQQQL